MTFDSVPHMFGRSDRRDWVRDTPTADGRWYAVRLNPDGLIRGVIPGLFDSKAAAEQNAKRDVGVPK